MKKSISQSKLIFIELFIQIATKRPDIDIKSERFIQKLYRFKLSAMQIPKYAADFMRKAAAEKILSCSDFAL